MRLLLDYSIVHHYLTTKLACLLIYPFTIASLTWLVYGAPSFNHCIRVFINLLLYYCVFTWLLYSAPLSNHYIRLLKTNPLLLPLLLDFYVVHDYLTTTFACLLIYFFTIVSFTWPLYVAPSSNHQNRMFINLPLYYCVFYLTFM